MSERAKKIGLIIGQEWEWPEAFMQMVNDSDENVTAKLVKLGGTFMGETCDYDVIIDRISHEIPYYRAFLKYAAIQRTYIINNPYTLSADSKFSGTALVNKLGLKSPRTVVLPNKQVERDATPNTFRNLEYPMDWQAIIDFVGVPAIFKDNQARGRRGVARVHNVDELIQQYDESGSRTKILQQIIESDQHVHSFVIGQENVLSLNYSVKNGRYQQMTLDNDSELGKQLATDALRITQAYQYDINMVEFVIKDEVAYVINGTYPTPDIDLALMNEEQFLWLVSQIAALAIKRAKRPLPQTGVFNQQEQTS
ncbi:ATP-grasp domain-containing protein [Candidatus Leptofilum sp.]|uniref:ATP-grasp domain-containing protein n=1 Tax=Candidatus Leptofilum sp. TaxID=3241576 RepID=UPI003B5C19DF